MSTLVRKAEQRDKLTFAFMVQQFTTESPYDLKINPDKLLSNFENAVDNPDVNIAFLEKDGEAIGVIVSALAPSLFSDDVMVAELVWYVQKEHRDARKAFLLMNEQEAWAKDRGCTFVSMGSLVSDSPEEEKRIETLYEKKGYALKEKTFVKGL